MSPNPTNSVLVLGAGELGLAVAHALAQHPSRSTAAISVLRRPVSADALTAARRQQRATFADLRIEELAGDVEKDDEDTLAGIFKGYGTVICCSGMSGYPGFQMKITKAAARAGVSRYVPWQFGTDYDAIGYGSAHERFDEQLDVRAFLRAQHDMQWLIVSTGAFMSMAFVSAFGIVERESSTVRAFGGWEKRLTVTDVGDIARVLAELVWDGGDVWGGQGLGVNKGIVLVAGDTVTYENLAETLEKVTGREWKRGLWTYEQLKRELEEDPENDLKKFRAIWGAGRGIAWDKETSFNGLRGMEMKSLEAFAGEELGS